MRTRMIDNQPNTYAVIFETGDEVALGLAAFAQERQLRASHFTAIGAFQDVTLGYFDWNKKDYERIPIHEQVEVLSLMGDIALDRGYAESARARHRWKIGRHGSRRASPGSPRETHAGGDHHRIGRRGELHKSYDPLSKLDLIKV